MFLQLLSGDERELFLSLATHVAKANGVYAAEEKQMIESFCREMGIVYFDSERFSDYENVCASLRDADPVTKKIVLTEALGIVYADGDFDSAEKEFLDDFSGRIGIEPETAEEIKKRLIAYIEAYHAIADTVLQ